VEQRGNATDAGLLGFPDQAVGIDHQAHRHTPPSGSVGASTRAYTKLGPEFWGVVVCIRAAVARGADQLLRREDFDARVANGNFRLLPPEVDRRRRRGD